MAISRLFFHISNCLNEFPKNVAFSVERATRPWELGEIGREDSHMAELAVRIKELFKCGVFLPLTAMTYPVSFVVSTLGWMLQQNRMNSDKVNKKIKKIDQKSLKIAFVNGCNQSGPFSQITGDQIHPLEKFDDEYPTRLDAFVSFFTEKELDIIGFQEGHDPMAMKNLRKKFNAKGYRIITDDLVHPIFVNSGLGFAVKDGLDFKNVRLIQFPLKDRAGVTKGAMQGCLSIELIDKAGQVWKFMTTHLAYGYNEHVKAVRRRQMKNHIFKDLSNEDLSNQDLSKMDRIIIGGDFNEHHLFDQMKAGEPERFKHFKDCNENVKNSRISQGQLRKKKPKVECVDGAICSQNFKVIESKVLQPQVNGRFFTDHLITYLEISMEKND